MKRLLSSILALTLGPGSIPAQAQVAPGRISLTTGVSTPAPVPVGLVAAAGSFTPALSAPALSVSPAPALLANLAEEALQPLKAAAQTAQPFSAVPPAPMETLRALAAPDALTRSDSRFDGAAEKTSADAEPVRGPAAASERPALDKPGAPAPRKPKKVGHPLYNLAGRSLLFGTALAAAAPILWGAVPSRHFTFTYIAASALMLAIAVPVEIGVRLWRRARENSQQQPSRRKKLAAVALGAALGLVIGAAPTIARAPLTDRVQAWQDSRLPLDQRVEARRIIGGAVEAETIARLSRNPIGRKVLNELRDRGGVLRLPLFFISRQSGSAAHEATFDGVYLAAAQITERGWTVEQFLKDPALQRRLIRDMESAVLHELVHAVQGRRAPWTPGYFKTALEHEYEAFINQHHYIHERLKSDSTFDLDNSAIDKDIYLGMADDLDAYLKSLGASYRDNVHASSPGFDAFLAKTRAAWPAHRVEIFLGMAERSARANDTGSATMYMDKAKAAAKAAGLPEPARSSR